MSSKQGARKRVGTNKKDKGHTTPVLYLAWEIEGNELAEKKGGKKTDKLNRSTVGEGGGKRDV